MQKSLYITSIIIIFGGINIFAIKSAEKTREWQNGTNNNTIRNDVEEKIAARYAGQPNRINGYDQFAKALQKAVSEDSMTQEIALEIDKEGPKQLNAYFRKI